MQADFFNATPSTAPLSQAPSMMGGGSAPWMTQSVTSPQGLVKKRRSEKDFPAGVPKGYWWKSEEAYAAQSKGEYIKVNGGERVGIASKPQKFSFEATVLKGAPFKKRKVKGGGVNPKAYSGQGLHVAFLDTITLGGSTILARLSGDPRDIALALLLSGTINPQNDRGQDISFATITDRAFQSAFLDTIVKEVIAQSYNYFTIVEHQGKGESTLSQMQQWDQMKGTDFYERTTMWLFLSNGQVKSEISSKIPRDILERFSEEARKRIDDKSGKDAALVDFQNEVLMYIFLSHHIKGPDCRKLGPDGKPVEAYTLPGAQRKHGFATLLQQVINDNAHVLDISQAVNGKGYRKTKTYRETKDKTSRAKGVPVNFSVTIGGLTVNVFNKVYSNNEQSVEIALKELGLDSQTIAGIKLNVRSALQIKHNAKLAKQKSPLPQALEFVAGGSSCQISRYPTTPVVAGHQSNVGANLVAVLGDEEEI